MPSGLRFAASDHRFTLLETEDRTVLLADGSHVGTVVDTGSNAHSVLTAAGLVTAGDAVAVRPLAADGTVGKHVAVDPGATGLVLVDGQPYAVNATALHPLAGGGTHLGAGVDGVVPSVVMSAEKSLGGGRRSAHHRDRRRLGDGHQPFVWEARVAEMVSGRPNLPHVLDSGFTVNGQPYLVTKVYDRGTLRRRVQVGGPLAPADVVAAGRQLAIALAALHENGIVHGDVKPENVFIDDDDSMVLGDLGAAWLRADGGPASAITPAYAAPAVWLGHAPTVVSDIYSLGLTLMFAATGRPPTMGAPPNEAEIMAAFGSDIAVPLLQIDPRRRLHTALATARRFGADVEEYTLVGSAEPLHLSTPSWTIQ